jgi:hypothetical protein
MWSGKKFPTFCRNMLPSSLWQNDYSILMTEAVVTLEHGQPSIRLHGISSWKTAIFVFTTLTTYKKCYSSQVINKIQLKFAMCKCRFPQSCIVQQFLWVFICLHVEKFHWHDPADSYLVSISQLSAGSAAKHPPSTNTSRFYRVLCITHRITGFSDFVHHLDSK